MRPNPSHAALVLSAVAICVGASAYTAWMGIAGATDAAPSRSHRPLASSLVNGEFERRLVPWVGFHARLGLADIGPPGDQALRISARHRASSYSLFHRPVFAARPGNSYRATAWVKSVRADQRLCIQLREFLAASTKGLARSCWVSPSRAWRKLSVNLVAREPGSYLALSLYATGARKGDRFLADTVAVDDAAERDLARRCRIGRARACKATPPASTTATPPSSPTSTAAPATTSTARVRTSTTTTTSASAPPPAPQTNATRFVGLAPGAALPSGADCAARVRRHTWEPRPQNATFNQTRGRPIQIPAASWEPEERANQLLRRVDGNFTGTTDEILQWASCKWGFDEDTARAVAVIESWWNQSATGDGGESIGLFQVRCMWGRYHQAACPDAQRSSAFNADYALAFRRVCFEGLFAYWGTSMQNTRGDLWGCIGLWFSGQWNQGNADYVTRVRNVYTARPWATDATFYNAYATAGAWPPK